MDICQSKKIPIMISKSEDRGIGVPTLSNGCKGTVSVITYLYHKRHLVTGLNYFGKTVRDPYKYKGSGIHWKRHLAVHGEKIETVQVWAFENLEECKQFAVDFSEKNNIVNSTDWANCVIENGIDGQSPGFKNPKLSEYNRQNPRTPPSRKGAKDSEDTIKKKRQAHLGKKYGPITEERREKISAATKGPRPHTAGKNNPMYGYIWTEEQKKLLKEKRKGKVWWNNGIGSKMSINCPGNGFSRGRLKK